MAPGWGSVTLRLAGGIGKPGSRATAGQDSGGCLGGRGRGRKARSTGKGLRWALGQALTRPLSHPPQPSSDARYGSQGRPQACLGPLAGSNLLGPEGEAPISSAELRKRQGEQRQRTGAKNKKWEGQVAKGAVEEPDQPSRAPSDPPLSTHWPRPSLTGPPCSPSPRVRDGRRGRGGRRTKGPEPPSVSCLTGKGDPCGWAGQSRAGGRAGLGAEQ